LQESAPTRKKQKKISLKTETIQAYPSIFLATEHSPVAARITQLQTQAPRLHIFNEGIRVAFHQVIYITRFEGIVVVQVDEDGACAVGKTSVVVHDVLEETGLVSPVLYEDISVFLSLLMPPPIVLMVQKSD